MSNSGSETRSREGRLNEHKEASWKRGERSRAVVCYYYRQYKQKVTLFFYLDLFLYGKVNWLESGEVY